MLSQPPGCRCQVPTPFLQIGHQPKPGTCVLSAELVKADRVAKALRIVITCGMVKQRPFWEALEEGLTPPLKQACELAALEPFKQQFDAAAFRKGLEVTFTTTDHTCGPQLTSRADGKQVCVQRSGRL